MKQIYYDRANSNIDDIIGMKFQSIEINADNMTMKFYSVKNVNAKIKIVIQAPWRIRDSNSKIIFGCEDSELKIAENKLYEKRMFYNFKDVEIELIDINEYMDVLIKFTNNMKLDIFTDTSVGEECWSIEKV
ncbi:MAG: hypothetical protein K2M78_12800 [Lachnospiraceae bacterium]|nr:hypothetical protein [Lachnospiraceae bacterium]